MSDPLDRPVTWGDLSRIADLFSRYARTLYSYRDHDHDLQGEAVEASAKIIREAFPVQSVAAESTPAAPQEDLRKFFDQAMAPDSLAGGIIRAYGSVPPPVEPAGDDLVGREAITPCPKCRRPTIAYHEGTEERDAEFRCYTCGARAMIDDYNAAIVARDKVIDEQAAELRRLRALQEPVGDYDAPRHMANLRTLNDDRAFGAANFIDRIVREKESLVRRAETAERKVGELHKQVNRLRSDPNSPAYLSMVADRDREYQRAESAEARADSLQSALKEATEALEAVQVRTESALSSIKTAT